MATAAKAKGFEVCCPRCLDADAVVSMDLNEIGTCRCSGCDEEFTAAEARDLFAAQLKRWQAVCEWVALADEARMRAAE